MGNATYVLEIILEPNFIQDVLFFQNGTGSFISFYFDFGYWVQFEAMFFCELLSVTVKF